MRDAEVAWAAGLFEGEGCIVLMRDGRRVQLALAMTDEDVVRRFVAVLGVGTQVVLAKDRREPHYKQQWRWQATAHDDVLAVLALLRPWLGERRGAKADEAVARIRWALVHCARGHDKPRASKGCATCNHNNAAAVAR